MIPAGLETGDNWLVRHVGSNGTLTLFVDGKNSIVLGNHQHGLQAFQETDCKGDAFVVPAMGSYIANWDSNTWRRYPVPGNPAVSIMSGDSCINVNRGWNPSYTISDKVTFDDDSWAQIKLTQPTPFHHTTVQVDYASAHNLNKWHVHVYQMEDGDSCTAVGGHYNPMNLDLNADSYGSGAQDTYEIGDLSGKHGLFSDWADSGSAQCPDSDLRWS